MTAPENPALAAIVSYISDGADVTALVSGRVYGQEIPRSEITSMPRKAVLVQSAGGGGSMSLELRTPQVDVWCIGETRYEADRVEHAVYHRLFNLQRETVDDRLIHWAHLVGGPLSGVDRDSDWPSVMSSYQIRVSEVKVS